MDIDLLEKFRDIGMEIQVHHEMLNDWIIRNYPERDSVESLKANIEENIRHLELQREKVVKFVEEIKDPTIRSIFYMKYIEGKEHKEICREVGYGYTYLSKVINKEVKRLKELEV